MRVEAELVDVSYEGTVHFTNVSLANVSLEHGAVVSTTLNDYQQAIGFYIMYYAEDDAAYDVDLVAVAPADAGVFGEEFRIVNDTLSDCIYLLRPADSVLPGCPVSSLAGRNRTIDRGYSGGGSRESTGVPFADENSAPDYGAAGVPAGALPPGDYGYSPGTGEDGYSGSGGMVIGTGVPFDYSSDSGYSNYGFGDYAGETGNQLFTIDVVDSPDQLTDYEVINDPQLRYTVLMVQEDDEWLLATQKVRRDLSL